MLTEVLKACLLLAWLASVSYCALSTYLLVSFFRRAGTGREDGQPEPPMTVMKPVRGADDDTYENLRSFVIQDYPHYQVVFGVAERTDPVVAVVDRLIAEHPELDLELIVTGRPAGTNLKVSSLIQMYPSAKHDIIVIADADMRVGPDYLGAVAAGFEDKSVGLVTCPYRGAFPGNVGAALEALTIDTDFLPSVAAAERLEGLSFALGATMAARREAIEAIGGLGILADYLADDYQLGNRIMKAGYGLRLSGYLVDSVGRSETVSGFFSHQLRWGRTYRVSRPGGYFMSVVTRLTPISLLFLMATAFSAAGWTVFGASIIIRYVQAVFIEAFMVRGPGVLRYMWLLPFRDIGGFVIWFMSFTGNTVKWADATFRIEKTGRMARL